MLLGRQQLNYIALSSCVSDSNEAVSLLKRNRVSLNTFKVDGAWARVPATIYRLLFSPSLDRVALTFKGQEVSPQELNRLFFHLSAPTNTQVRELLLDIDRSDLNGVSVWVGRAWFLFGKVLEARKVESLTLIGTAFDLLRIRGLCKMGFHRITSVRLINNIWSLNHSLQYWLVVFPRLNHLSFRLTNGISQYFSSNNVSRPRNIEKDLPSVLNTNSCVTLCNFIPLNIDTVVGEFNRLTDNTFAVSISPE